jgi:hypothetical protein
MFGASHDVYLGTERDAIAGADNTAPEFQGNQAGISLSLGPCTTPPLMLTETLCLSSAGRLTELFARLFSSLRKKYVPHRSQSWEETAFLRH